MKIELNKENYLTGNYATVGGGKSWFEVDNLPIFTDDEDFSNKIICYKYVDGEFTFNKEKYNETKLKRISEELNIKKKTLIAQSRQNLADYLACHTVTSACHGEPAEYSITSEKQSYLANMIMTSQMAQAAGIDFKPSWNATGQVSTYDWTLEQLQQLTFEIEAVVRPLVSKQQEMEIQLTSAQSLEELELVDISFNNI